VGRLEEPLSMVPQKLTESETLTIPEVEQSKAAMLNTLTSVHSRRSYAFAIGRFIAWYCSGPSPRPHPARSLAILSLEWVRIQHFCVKRRRAHRDGEAI
jgi:hypothetical protein